GHLPAGGAGVVPAVPQLCHPRLPRPATGRRPELPTLGPVSPMAHPRPERGMRLAPFDRVAPDVVAAGELMARFAERTAGARRYLWTDAFAVCNLLELARASGDNRHREAALRLVGGVHHTLGRHRADDTRRGWISGLPAADAEAHPTVGGLRIGKPLPERGPGEPLDERREWDRDGQYFHYATKWMHALDQAAREMGQPIFNTWA